MVLRVPADNDEAAFRAAELPPHDTDVLKGLRGGQEDGRA
jgi:hypothetical protein